MGHKHATRRRRIWPLSHMPQSALSRSCQKMRTTPACWRRRIPAIGAILCPAIRITWWSSVPAPPASLLRLALQAWARAWLWSNGTSWGGLS